MRQLQLVHHCLGFDPAASQNRSSTGIFQAHPLVRVGFAAWAHPDTLPPRVICSVLIKEMMFYDIARRKYSKQKEPFHCKAVLFRFFEVAVSFMNQVIECNRVVATCSTADAIFANENPLGIGSKTALPYQEFDQIYIENMMYEYLIDMCLYFEITNSAATQSMVHWRILITNRIFATFCVLQHEMSSIMLLVN